MINFYPSSASLRDLSTDKEIMHFDKITECSLEPSYEFLDKEKLTFDTNIEFNATLKDCYINEALLQNIKPHYTVIAEVPIMIQARWHKKKRINKKWLKRYGLKPDTVKAEMDAEQLEYHPGEIAKTDNAGIIVAYNYFDFQAKDIKYIFRNDQLRKGLKIVW